MIKMNDLRIGNWVFWLNGPERVSSLTQTSASFPDGFCLIDIIDPIRLESAHLQKAGFQLSAAFPGLWEHPKTGMLRYLETARGWLVKSKSGDKITCIKHLHHLQNFFFAITGEELEISL